MPTRDIREPTRQPDTTEPLDVRVERKRGRKTIGKSLDRRATVTPDRTREGFVSGGMIGALAGGALLGPVGAVAGAGAGAAAGGMIKGKEHA